ncbi:MAG: hypothetical protein H6729_17495 [Deltaproteobacteria bacterium]|nr:hypothetical protein [Deltaproteobacteria bacterium]
MNAPRIASRVILLAAALWVGSARAAPSHGAATARAYIQAEESAAPAEASLASSGLKDCRSAAILDEAHMALACSSCVRGDQRCEPSRGLFVVQRVTEQSGSSGGVEWSLLSRERAFGDAYYATLSVFAPDLGGAENARLEGADAQPTILLAESGDESSYGVSVFVWANGKLTQAGSIDAVLDDDGSAVSVVPALRIAPEDGVVVFSFTKNVMCPDKKGGYIETPPAALSYRLEEGHLKRVGKNARTKAAKKTQSKARQKAKKRSPRPAVKATSQKKH